MVYVHIPFCRNKCIYCGFYSELLRLGDGGSEFVDALRREIATTDADFASRSARTLYFGGGTPSLLSAQQLAAIVDALAAKGLYDRQKCLEFTMEVNPDDIVSGGAAYLDSLRNIGVNRVSMGVQSFDDTVLRRMGRRHNGAEAVKAYEMLRSAGFDNISIDLIIGFSQSFDPSSVHSALCGLSGLPQHVSCYELSIESGSGLEKMLSRGKFSIPGEEECAAQYEELCSLMQSLGYEHYEISNWALGPHRSSHNSAYWTHEPYVGFGPGAHSFDSRRRYWNNPDLKAYLDAAAKGDFSPVRGEEALTAEQLLEEKIMLGLRTADGIPPNLLDPSKCRSAMESGVLEASKTVPGNVRIAARHWIVSDSIIASLV